MPEENGGLGEPGEKSELAEQSASVLAALHAAMVNFHLYPPTSDIVNDSVSRALDDLKLAISSQESITFSELEGKLLINDFCLDEREQSKANTVSFLKDLALWEVKSITFEAGLSEDDMRAFLEVFSRKRADRTLAGNLSSFLEESGVSNIRVDEKIYVSLSKDQDISSMTPSGQDVGAMGLLKDEVFVRYLVGSAPAMEVSQEEVSDLMSDPKRINTAFQSAMFSFEAAGGSAVGPDKARAIKDTVNRMYGLVDNLADEEVKNVLHDEMVNILATLDPETLVEVLSEESPEVVRETETRREIVSSVEGENVLKLTDHVIEKYRVLLADRGEMDIQDYYDISSVLNEIIADIYQEGDPSYHPEITRRLRESGLLVELAQSHPQAGMEMEVYTIVTDIRAAGSLRPLEGLDIEEVIAVAGKLLDLGDKEIAQKIIAVTAGNLGSERPDFRARACRFLKEMHVDFRERGHGEEIVDRSGELLDMLDAEEEVEVAQSLIELLGSIAGDLFLRGKLDEFCRLVETLAEMVEEEEDERLSIAARSALSSLNPWDIGKPLTESLFSVDERMGDIAARLLPYIEESLTAQQIMERLKSDEDIKITPQLAEVARGLGEPIMAYLSEMIESNVREELYIRAIQLLEAMGGSEPLAQVKAAANNPIPSVRVQAFRSMAKISPGDPTLLTHFMQALEDDEVDVRREGARGLGTIDDPRSVDTLLVIIQGKSMSGGEEHPRVEEAACLALGRLGPEKAVSVMSDLLRKRTFALRRRSVHPRVKASACYTLGQIGGPEVVEIIRPYLDDSDPIVRNEARKAISTLRRRGYVD
ncbi:MAG: HEAT repeat domain-containing protein [Actinomycetota bacterium]|nr:HEAT repeat domain-containing protein [Actinomycetota bacterium]